MGHEGKTRGENHERYNFIFFSLLSFFFLQNMFQRLPVERTPGYIDPEYIETQEVTDKCDVGELWNIQGRDK